jgi:hypothetical protein
VRLEVVLTDRTLRVFGEPVLDAPAVESMKTHQEDFLLLLSNILLTDNTRHRLASMPRHWQNRHLLLRQPPILLLLGRIHIIDLSPPRHDILEHELPWRPR